MSQGRPLSPFRALLPWALLRAAPLIGALLGIAAPLPAQVTGRLELPSHAVAGGRARVRLSFRDQAGKPLLEPLTFQLAVTGARYARVALAGNLLFGGGASFLGGETAGGVFEIELDTPEERLLRFNFQETSEIGVTSFLKVVFIDGVSGDRPRWVGSTLGGPLSSFRIIEVPPLPGEVREGSLAWWSGPQGPSQDSALVSVPIAVPSRGEATLGFLQRRDLEAPECPAGLRPHHGMRVEAQNAAGAWVPLIPRGGYPHTIHSACAHPLSGQGVFGGSTGSGFEESRFDLRPLLGLRSRVRFRLATGCEPCGAEGGLFIDDVVLESTELVLPVIDPASDPDGDGLPGAVEVARGTDPLSADTDGDGLADGAEDGSGSFEGPDRTGSDPLSPDTDGGGVPDLVEAHLGTDPSLRSDEPIRERLPLEVPSPGRVPWIVREDGSLGESGAGRLDEVFSGKGGLRLLLGALPLPPAAESFSGDGGKSHLIGVHELGSVLAARVVSTSPDGSALRVLDLFQNHRDQPLGGTLILECEFAQDRWVEVESTAGGSAEWGPLEDHVHFNDRDPRHGMPALLWAYSGKDARVEPSAASLLDGVARLAFPLQLEPGERRMYLSYLARSDGLAASREAARLLENQGADLLGGLPPGHEERIVNFSFDGDGDGMPGFFELGNGFDPRDPSDGEGDADQDGLKNRDEFRHRTDPRSSDSDGDGLADGVEVKDLHTLPTSPDSDGDGIQDGKDPFPLSLLLVSFEEEAFSFPDRDAAVVVRITDRGAPFLGMVRFTLLAEGGESVFAPPVEGGQVLAGLGTKAAQVEMGGGSLRIHLHSAAVGRVKVSMADAEGAGLVAPAAVAEDFEGGEGGFSAEGPSGAWKWGEPAIVQGAFSGERVWATGLGGSYPPEAYDTLTTPEFALSRDGAPHMEVQSLLEVEEPYDQAIIHISTGKEFEPLGNDGPIPPSPGRYQRLLFNLNSFRGKKVRLRFLFQSDSSEEMRGWFIDDFKIEGLKTAAVVDFLDPLLDLDRDGLSNRTEIERGLDPGSTDTDGDGLADGVETGTGVLVSRSDTGTQAARADTDGGGEDDGSEVSAGRDPHRPEDDALRITFDSPLAQVHFSDGSGNGWESSALGSAQAGGEAFFIILNFLQYSDTFFADLDGTLSLEGQLLYLDGKGDLPFEQSASRKLFIGRQSRFIRWLDVFENPEATPVDLEIAYESHAFSEFPLEVVATGDGDMQVEGEDQYLVARIPTGEGEMFLGLRWQGPSPALGAERIAFGLDSLSILYSTALPPRGKVGLLQFAALNPSREAVVETMETLARMSPAALVGLGAEEVSLIANYRIDSDGDGMVDDYELRNGLDPADPSDGAEDADGDGLSNISEYRLGTDPRKIDSDGDGLSDGQEVERLTDPSGKDSDGDRIPDGADPWPLHRLFARQKEVVHGIAGERTPLRIRFEAIPSRDGPDTRIPFEEVALAIRISPPLEVLGVLGGKALSVEGDIHHFQLEGERLVLEVASAAAGTFDVHVLDPRALGVSGDPARLQFFQGAGDADGDRLPDAFEIEQGTDPLQKDTDRDGLPDGVETGSGVVLQGVEAGTFPWAGDSDGGGSPDGNEMFSGSDPLEGGDDLASAALPRALIGASGGWEVLPSWSVAGGGPGVQEADNLGSLRVGGKPLPFQATAWIDPGKSVLRLGPVSHEGLTVSRFLHAHPSAPVLRFTEVVTNHSPAGARVAIDLRWDYGSDSGTLVDSTSTGDALVDAADRWVLFRLGQRAFLRVAYGEGSLEKVERLEADLYRELFTLEVPAGATRTLVHLVAQRLSRGDLLALAGKLASLKGGVIDGLAADHLGSAANLKLPSPIVWEALPRSGVGPGGLFRLRGEFLRPGLEVLVGGAPAAAAAIFSDQVLLRAPGTPGEHRIEFREAVGGAGGKTMFFPQSVLVIEPRGHFRRGDLDGDARLDLTDPIRIIEVLFLGGARPPCLDTADSDDSGDLNLTDAIHLLQVLFQGPGSIPYPGVAVPGPDPTPDALLCPAGGG